MKEVTQSGRWGERLRTAIVAFALLVAGAFVATATSPAHAAPAAGTVIGNQATATYTDAGGTPRTATSNLVQTTVSQIKSFTLTADGARTASAGQTVYYPHTITNTGNGTDTYALNAPATGGTVIHTGLVYYIDSDGNGVPDNFTPIVTSGPIAAAGIFRFVVAGTVPGTAVNGTTGTITVSVSDTDAPVETQTNIDTTTVANSAISVTKSLSVTSGTSPYPNPPTTTTPITVTLSYTNSGSAAATNLVLTDVINPLNGFTYVPGSGRWSVSGGTALTDGAGGDPAGIAYEFTVGNAVTATIASVPAGFSGTLTFQVAVNSGRVPGFINNTASYQTDTQAVTNSNTASYQVVQTAAVVANGSTTVSTNGTGEPVTIASAAAGSTINFTNVIWNMGNAADGFVISLAGSTFPAGSTLTLLQSDGVTSLIANTTPAIPVYSAGCAAGFETDGANFRCGYRVILRVQLPVGATGGPYSVTKTAVSNFDNTKSDTVTDTLTAVTANSVDVTNNTARADSLPAGTAVIGNQATTGFGASGTAVITTNTVTPSTTSATVTRFRLHVNNTGAINDSFNLSVAGTPAGWSVVFRADGGVGDCSTVGTSLTTTGTVNAGANRLVCAEVTVPVTTSGQAAAGNYDLDFTAASALNPGVVNDVKRDRVTVNAVHAVSLTPNNTQQTFPGGSVTYSHVLTNLGNASETITFPGTFLTDSRSGQGWTSVAYLDGNSNGTFDPGVDDVPANLVSNALTFALGVNTSRTVFVRVFAPGSAAPADPANVTTITATYNSGGSTASATDSTSVTDGLVLLKEQATTGADCAAPIGAYSSAPIPQGTATRPGQCIAYRITATNTTAANIGAVVINDNVPASTSLYVTAPCGNPATTVGSVTAPAVPANGFTGTISASVGPLTPSQSAVVTFCVRIDP